MVKNGEPINALGQPLPQSRIAVSGSLPADSYARAVLMALADAWDELPEGWRATLERL